MLLYMCYNRLIRQNWLLKIVIANGGGLLQPLLYVAIFQNMLLNVLQFEEYENFAKIDYLIKSFKCTP